MVSAFSPLLLLVIWFTTACCSPVFDGVDYGDRLLFNISIPVSWDIAGTANYHRYLPIYMNDNVPLKVVLFCNKMSLMSMEDQNSVFAEVLQAFNRFSYLGTIYVAYSPSDGGPAVYYRLSELISNLITHPLQNDIQVREILYLLWGYVNEQLRKVFRPAVAAITNPNVLFVTGIPNWVPLGIGSILKTYASLKSIHPNTKIRNLPGYILGNYSSILEDSEIVSSEDDRIYTGQHIIECLS